MINLDPEPDAPARRFRIASPLRRFRKGSSNSDAKTTTETVNTTTTQDRKIAAEAGSIVAAEGSTINAHIESLDARVAAAAISGATQSAASASASNAAVTDRAFSFGDETVRRSLALADSTITANGNLAATTIAATATGQREIVDFTNQAISKTTEAFKAAQSGSTAQLQDTLKKIALAGLFVGGAVAVTYVLKKK